MKCPKTGFTPLKILTLIVTGIALVVHIAAVAYPVWDQIDAGWKPSPMMSMSLKIRASGSLWDFTIHLDETHKFFPPVPTEKNKAWKEPIKLMELTAIGVGVLGGALVILSAFIDRCMQNYITRLLSRVLAITALMCASLEIILGAMLYKYQYTKTTSNQASNLNLKYPIDKYLLAMGWELECAAGGLFLMATLIAITEAIHNSPSKDGSNSTLVTPFEEKTHNSDRKIREEEKRQTKTEKLVVEDINDEKPTKKS